MLTLIGGVEEVSGFEAAAAAGVRRVTCFVVFPSPRTRGTAGFIITCTRVCVSVFLGARACVRESLFRRTCVRGRLLSARSRCRILALTLA